MVPECPYCHAPWKPIAGKFYHAPDCTRPPREPRGRRLEHLHTVEDQRAGVTTVVRKTNPYRDPDGRDIDWDEIGEA